MMTHKQELCQIRRAVKSRRGAMAEIARERGVSQVTVSLVLMGKRQSGPIMELAKKMAMEIKEESCARV